MKCSRCGYRAKDIAHLAAHYRKAHPDALKKKRAAAKPKRKGSKGGYCSKCGRPL